MPHAGGQITTCLYGAAGLPRRSCPADAPEEFLAVMESIEVDYGEPVALYGGGRGR